MSDLDDLIRANRTNGVLLDTNLVILLLVGQTNPRRIGEFSRTSAYSSDDFDLLVDFLNQFDKILTTPHVLAEVSNLAKLPGKGPDSNKLRKRFQEYVLDMSEVFKESRLAAEEPHFAYLGMADAAIALVAQEPMLVLTDDWRLYQRLLELGLDALRFENLRNGWV